VSVTQVGGVDFDIVLLADTVEATDTLFQLVDGGGQVEHHQTVAELEVAALGTDFRADQGLGTVFVGGEPGGAAVTLDQGKVFVEGAALDAALEVQVGLQSTGGVLVVADDEEFVLAVFLQDVQ